MSETSLIYICYDRRAHSGSVEGTDISPLGVRVQQSKPISKILRAYIRSINLTSPSNNKQPKQVTPSLTNQGIEAEASKYEMLKCICKDKARKSNGRKSGSDPPHFENLNQSLIEADIRDGDRVWLRRKKKEKVEGSAGTSAAAASASGSGSKAVKKEKKMEVDENEEEDEEDEEEEEEEEEGKGKGKKVEKEVEKKVEKKVKSKAAKKAEDEYKEKPNSYLKAKEAKEAAQKEKAVQKPSKTKITTRSACLSS